MFPNEQDFFDIEETIKTLISQNCEDFQDLEIIQRGSLDVAYTATFSKYPEYPRFCIIEFDGGYLDQQSRTFDGPATWYHSFNVEFYIALKAASKTQEVEDDSRKAYYQFVKTIGNNRRCLGNNKMMEVFRAYAPDRVEIRKQSYIKLSINLRVKEVLS